MVIGVIYRRTHSPSQLVWSELAVTQRSVCIHQVNWVNSCNGFGHDDSIINIVICIIIIFLY